MNKMQRGAWVAVSMFAIAGCGTEAKSDGPVTTVEEGTARYGEFWGEWCNDLDCDPTDVAWQDGRINGHAVRPVEKCAPETDYPGDDAALCPPEAGEGFQIHFGPSSYDDAEEVSRFLAEPYQEIEECQYLRMPNTERAYVNQFSGTMRPQSHHMILWGPVGEDHDEGLSDCQAAAGLESGFLLGSQTPTISLPDLNAAMTPDESKTVNLIEPDMLVALDLHYVNRSAEPILRESWVNLYTTELEEDDEVLNPIFLVGTGINVPPMSTGTKFKYNCDAPTDMRITLLTGHHHENSTRFSISIQRAGQTPEQAELVYENLDALDPFMATYAANYELRTPDRDNGISGGKGGTLTLAEGDKLIWECEFDNPTANTVKLGETSTDQMCNVFGAFVTDGDVGTWNAAFFAGSCISSDLLGNVGLGG